MWIIFDVDGVLIDTSKSYDMAVKMTVEHILRKYGVMSSISLDEIRGLRQRKSFSDDFELSEWIIRKYLKSEDTEMNHYFSRGISIEIERVFNTYYLGELYSHRIFPYPGLWKHERPLLSSAILEDLSRRGFKLGVITGRDRLELRIAEHLLNFRFSHAVTREDYRKPDPRALWSITNGELGVYIGDSKVDELLVKKYRRSYGEFLFIMVPRDAESTAQAVEMIGNINRKKH